MHFLPTFFREFIKKSGAVGSVTPSSRYLTRAMLEPIAWESAQHVVEFGSGTGVMTREIVQRLPFTARLDAFELNDTFIGELQQIHDPRFFLHAASAWSILDFCPAQSVDVVVSGLPLSNFSESQTKELLVHIQRVLRPGGLYIQFQYFPIRYRLIKTFFPSTQVRCVFRNIPPACVYVAHQSAVAANEKPLISPIRRQATSLV